MTNAELIAALQTDIREVEDNPVNTLRLMWRAADALEAADKRIVNLLTALHLANEKLAYVDCQPYTEIDGEEMIDDWVKTLVYEELHTQMPKEGECEEKKPKTVKETEYSFYCDCPTCGGRLISNVDGEWCAGSFDRFCRMCGQKIDWSEYCGWSNKPYCGARMRGEHDEQADN